MNNSADFAPEVDPYQSEFSGVQNWREASCHPVSHPVSARHSGYLFFKRLFDIVLSSLALVALSPLFLAVAIAIKLDSKGPVIYSQLRAGKGGKIFTFYKFRSMFMDADQKQMLLLSRNEADGPVFKIADDPRITKVGRFLRKTSIDEFPQLINILRGEMSIVGPRPPLLREMVQYTPEQMHRLDVKPGLTCYWQISGRSDLSFEKWMELDFQYIRERSLWTDFKIILKTFPAVLSERGAY
jgi:exopolysaccharide biosynthesis polyprenyl glycosylphosphotransferase